MALRHPVPLLTSITILALANIGKAQAQQPTDTMRLKEVEVAATRLNTFLAGTKVQRMDSAMLTRYHGLDLGDLLANETPVFVKSYGLGSLATTSFRGGSANHTAILWNGFNIGSPMNGEVDLSLIPVGVANEVSVQYGGGSALWGSGAVGGTVFLNNVPQFGKGLQVDGGLTFGSFGDRRQRLRAEVAQGRSITSVALYNAYADNDFTYRTGDAERTQRNASLERQGVVVEQHLRLGADQQLSLRYWYQAADRHIPPTRLQELSTASQQDASHRGMAEWRRDRGKWSTQVRAALFDERLDWHGSVEAAPSLSRSRIIIAEAEARYTLSSSHTLDAGVNNTYAQASTDGYPEEPHQDRMALFSSYRYRPKSGRFVGSLAVRQELLEGRAVPFTGAIGGEYRLRNWALLKAQMARVYRIPTFNDLYWRPGGNPDLLPEKGYSGDLGIVVRYALRRITWRSEVTWFNRLLDDWIIWLPGPAYWSPSNIMQVWSRGVETSSELAYTIRSTTLKLGVGTNYVVSTSQVAKSVYDGSVDKQLIYVPMYSGNARAALVRDGCSFSVSATYTGYRYTSTDNRQFLEPYRLLNASASVRVFRKPHWRADATLNINNLLDTEYEVMLTRPMPLRNFQAGLSFHFDHPLPTKPHVP